MARKPKKLPDIPDFRDLDKILRATKRPRDRLMLMLARYCGLRVSEITKLKVEHLDFGRNFLMVRCGKGAKDRCMPLPECLRGPLRSWIESKRLGPSSPVFPSPIGGKHLTTRGVQMLVKRLALAAGVVNASKRGYFRPHAYRHQFASTLLANGVPIHEVRDLLGHSSIAVTDRYSHSSPEQLRSAIERAR